MGSEMALTYAIILAGGRGLRLNSDVPKQFLPLGTRPVIAWSIQAFNSSEAVDRVLVVIPNEFVARMEEIIDRYKFHKVEKIIPGGSTRQESAFNAIQYLDYNDDDILLFHDAARPFIKQEIICDCIEAAKKHGAAAVYVPVQDTIAEIGDGFAVSVPPRDRFYSAQTPQAFLFSVMRRAHLYGTGVPATDDASLAINAGFPVKMVQGDYTNFKITTELDYRSACLMAENIIIKK
jgi:2-C-methyl-D-erythritol 4-phosphate cytidylyltransferase